MRACAAALVAAGLAGLTLAGCELDRGAGYVELKTLGLGAGPILVLDSARLDPLRKGQAVLRAKVGSHKLQVEGPGGMLVSLCELANGKAREPDASRAWDKYSIISLMRIAAFAALARGPGTTHPSHQKTLPLGISVRRFSEQRGHALPVAEQARRCEPGRVRC